ncbi:MgtC/SapB family protein [Novisyntrophococcus fermenticellae]|uniref:MgtC/SapB family protein n=1 Tax=Novisyntrophococcus fermenticellae TaxID=2068655 RepID=UPI002F3E90D2
MSIADFMLQSEYILRIFVASVCGCVIGYERTNRNKEAGIRTHAIVAVGAALIMIVSKYGFSDSADFDASRVAAQIVSGIGFLGAGIIFLRNRMVSGLTTAAGIWTTGGIGMAIGSGLYYIGIATAVLVVFIQVLMHKSIFNREMEKDIVKLRIKEGGNVRKVEKILQTYEDYHTDIIGLDYKKTEPPETELTVELILRKDQSLMEFVTLLSENPEVVVVKSMRG